MGNIFPAYKPSIATSSERDFKVNIAKFGDGYEQRSKSGLNNSPLKFNVVFNKRKTEEISHIDAFLTSMAGVTAFEWTPPAPHNYSDAPLFVLGTFYKAGDRAQSGEKVYVCLQDNNTQALSTVDYWMFVCRLPMKWKCEKIGWNINGFNNTSLTAVFEQVFEA